MAPICGFCWGEMADIDFHLEGKCQITRPTSKPIGLTIMCDRIGCALGYNHAVPDEHRCRHGILMDRPINSGVLSQNCQMFVCECCQNSVSDPVGTKPICRCCRDVGEQSKVTENETRLLGGVIPDIIRDAGGSLSIASNKPAPPALPQTKSCACGCGLEIAVSGTIMSTGTYLHWKQHNFTSGSAEYLCNGSYKVTHSPGAILGYADNQMKGVATIHDVQLWLRGGRDLLGYCLCFVRPKSQCRFHAGGIVTEGPHNIMPAVVSAEFLRSWLTGRKIEDQPESPLPLKDIDRAIDAKNLIGEAPSRIKDINSLVKSWACKRGHSLQSEKQTIRFTDANGNMAESGPLCWLCVIDFANREFPAFEVKDG